MNTRHLLKTAEQRLFFLRKLKQAGLSSQLLVNFYMGSVESILCLSTPMWYGSCTAQDRKHLSRVVKTAQGIVGCPLLDLNYLYTGGIQWKNNYIETDTTYLGNGLLVPPSSWEQYRNIITKTNRLKHTVASFPELRKQSLPLLAHRCTHIFPLQTHSHIH